MQYEALIRDAWRLTWRFRSLWVLGLFAGGSSGSSCSWSNGVGPRGGTNTPQAIPGDVGDTVGTWVSANVGTIVAVASVIAVLVFIGVIVSFIAQGGLTRAGADALAGGTPTLGTAWANGRRYFWRYVGLALVLVAVAIGITIVAGLAVAMIFAVRSTGGDGPAAIVTALVGLVLGIGGLAVAFALASTVAFAQRAIVLADVGPFDALRAGWGMFRAHLVNCAVLWILSIALGIAAGFGIAIVLLLAAVPLVVIGALFWFTLGPGVAFATWVAIGVIAAIAVVFVIASIIGTFFWHFWTIAYLRLSTPAVAAA